MPQKSNKRLAHGFTLAELIVVMALMSILTGAIIAFINPVGDLFRKTSEYTHQRAAGNLLMDNITANLRYADEMLVLENYEGVPIISTSNGLDQYNRCFVFEYYPATTTNADGETILYRMNEQPDFEGRMWSFSINPSGELRVKDAQVSLGEGVYDKDKVYFGTTFGAADKVNSDISFRIRFFNQKNKPTYQTVNQISLMNYNFDNFVIGENDAFPADSSATPDSTGLPVGAGKTFTYVFYNVPNIYN